MKIYDQIVVVIFLNLYVGPAYERETNMNCYKFIYVLGIAILFPKIKEIVIFYHDVLLKCCENFKR